MEITFLYDLVVNEIVDYRKEQEKIDGCFNKYEREKKEKLENMLNDEQRAIFKSYCHSKALVEEDIDYAVGKRILIYGIKIGMELSSSLESIK